MKYPVTDFTSGKYVVILRDPLERWLSGTVEFLQSSYAKQNAHHFSYTQVLDVFFRDQVFLDAHTYPQHWFINSIDRDNITWVYFDNNLSNTLEQLFNRYQLEYTMPLKQNVGKNNTTKTQLYNEYKSVLDNEKYKSQLIDLYKQDYQLIESVNFYNTR